MHKKHIKGTVLRGLRFLLSRKSLIGLLVANLITFVPFLGGFFLMPLLEVSTAPESGITQFLFNDAVWEVAKFGSTGSLLGTLVLAVPVICYLHSRDKTNYEDYVSTLLLWLFCVCLLVSCVTFFMTKNIANIMAVFLFFPIVWIPAWMACAVYWTIAVKEPQNTIETPSKIMFVLTLLLWSFMSIIFGGVIATD